MNSVSTIISSHRKERHMTLMELCEELNKKGINIKHKAVSAWETGTAQPSLQAFFALCEIFEIEDIYEEIYGYNQYNRMSLLNSVGRERVNEYINMLLKDEKFIKSVPVTDTHVIHETIRLYEMPVSAGPGNFLEESTYEDVNVDDTVPAGASFGVRISGDSMTPRYKDGQVIWIKQQSTIDNGEIGIFLLNNNAYCKKFRNSNKGTALISLNKKYAPITVSEEDAFIVFGKVLN